MDVAKLEASLAEAKKLAEEAGGTDENLNSALKSAEDALSRAKAQDDPSKKKFSRRERLNFEKKKIEEQLSGLDKEEGVKPTSEEDDDKPLTKGEFKKMQKKEAQETALTLAEALEDETDREQVKNYLQNSIVPSGNAEEDFKLALSAVSALKNAEIVFIHQRGFCVARERT